MISDRELNSFRNWLLEEMLVVEETATLYVRDVRIVYEYGNPITFLKSNARGLAPKTLQHYLAALRQWAVFKEDTDLTRKLGKRMSRALPQPTALRPKYPIEPEDWLAFRRELEIAKDYLTEPVWAVITFMAKRGVRVSDVLRLERRTIREALHAPSFFMTTKKRKRLEVQTERVKDCLKTFLKGSSWERVEDLVSPGSEPERRRQSASMTIRRGVARVADRVNVPGVHPHRLRRTVMSNFLDRAKGDVNKLMDFGGWSSYEVARGYVANRDRAGLRQIEDTLDDDL